MIIFFSKDLVYAVAYHVGSAELLCLSDHCQIWSSLISVMKMLSNNDPVKHIA